MKSNRPNTSAMPSPTFTYATTCSVPRSSPLLSSSFTPFYPRSQQKLYNTHLDPPGNYDGGFHASPQKSDDNDIDNGHPYGWSCARGPKFYDQQYYASSGSEPYEVSWMANDGNMWGGGAWQWGDVAPAEYAYADAEDDAEDSAYIHSDSLSYYAESPALEQEFHACSTSNIESAPAPLSDRGAAASFSVFHSSTMPEQASFLSKRNGNLMPSYRKISTKEQAVLVRASEKQGPANGIINEVATTSASTKLDAMPLSMRVSSQIGSSVGTASRAVEPRLKQVAADMADNKRAQTEISKLSKSSCKLSSEQGSLDATESKDLINAVSNPSNTLKLFEGTNLDSSTISLPGKVVQKEVGNIDSSCFQGGHPQSTSGHCLVMNNAQACSSTVEQTIKGSSLNKASMVMEMEGKPCVEAIDLEAMHQDKTSSSDSLPGDAALCSNGPQLLVKSIQNLSKVLLSSQSGTSFNILDPTACLAIENTICMLSQRLFQSSVNEANFCQDQNYSQLQVAEHVLKNFDDSMKSYKEGGNEGYPQKCSSMHSLEKVSPKRALENEACEKYSKVTFRNWVGVEKSDYSTSMKKNFEGPWEDLSMLRGQVRKLQEEVAYEREESNVTVSTYKKLWSEAQEALQVSKSEIREMRAELSGLSTEFRNVKHLEGSGGLRSISLKPIKHDTSTIINQGGMYENFSDVATSSSMALNLCRVPNGDGNNAFCGSFKEHSPESSKVRTGYFDPGEISNCRENWTSLSSSEKAILRRNNQAASSNQNGIKSEVSANEKHTFGLPTNLEDEVTRRLSLLLARRGLDLNKTCTDRNVESPSDSHTFLDPSSDLPREGEAIPPDKNYPIWSETSHMVNGNKGAGCVKADLNCQMNSDLELKNGHHGPLEREPTESAVNAAEVKVSTCQEDEIEIICFKPAVADNFTCLKGEPEWEHVVVNVLDDDGVISRKVR